MCFLLRFELDFLYNLFLEYEYERTKDGEVISGYPDKENHHIDAVRYALEHIINNKSKGPININY